MLISGDRKINKRLVAVLVAVRYRLMAPEGFEPSHPKIPDLKSGALDHSAKKPEVVCCVVGLNTMLYRLS